MTNEQETLVFKMLAASAQLVTNEIERRRKSDLFHFPRCPSCEKQLEWGEEDAYIGHTPDCILMLHAQLLATFKKD